MSPLSFFMGLRYTRIIRMPILEVNNLSVRLDGAEVVRNINFTLEEGESLAIIGPNGSGKTTLFKALLGLVPYSGEIKWSPNIKLGYVPQKIDADRHLPINLRNLLTAKAKILGLPKEEVKSGAAAVGLTNGILKTPIGHLSGGQFQKALIAFALLGQPKVILFDEPTASLDELSEEHVYDLIHELQDNRGITVILVSHDLSVVSQYATKVLCMNKEGICYGTPEEALTPENLRKLYAAPHKYFHHLGHHHEDQ